MPSRSGRSTRRSPGSPAASRHRARPAPSSPPTSSSRNHRQEAVSQQGLRDRQNILLGGAGRDSVGLRDLRADVLKAALPVDQVPDLRAGGIEVPDLTAL